jgi:hypothetical protein
MWLRGVLVFQPLSISCNGKTNYTQHLSSRIPIIGLGNGVGVEG